MFRHYKILATIALAGSLVTMTGCIIPPDNNSSYGSSTGNYNHPNPSYATASDSTEWDRGCNDAKRGHYDQNRHNQAYKDGYHACEAGGDNQSGAQQQGGVHAAKQACHFQFGKSGHVQTVTPLKPGFWEIIVVDNSGRKVACTADGKGNVSDWVEM